MKYLQEYQQMQVWIGEDNALTQIRHWAIN